MSTTLIIVIGAIGVILLGVLRSVATAEIQGWIPVVSRRLVTRAVKRLPPAQRERYREEWTAELELLDKRPLSMLVFAAGLKRGARTMSRDALEAPPTAGVIAGAAAETAASSVERIREAHRKVDEMLRRTRDERPAWSAIVSEMDDIVGNVQSDTDAALQHTTATLDGLVRSSRAHGSSDGMRRRYRLVDHLYGKTRD